MNILQSPAWEQFQKDLDRQTFRRQGENWQYLAILEHGKGNSRLYCPYGPVAENHQAFQAALDDLTELATQQKVTFIRIEPTDASEASYLKHHKWQKVTYQSLNPEHTNIIDLSPTEEEIIAKMSPSNRNYYRNYHKKGLTITKSKNPADIAIFIELIHQVAERTGMTPHSDQYFKQQAESLFPIGAASLYIAKVEDRPIGATIIYHDKNMAHYAHAATDLSAEYKKLKTATTLVSYAIVDAKKQGLKYFNLYGIAPDGSPSDHPWAGFTKFKRSFGGEDVTYAGAWDLPIKKVAYMSYRLYQKARQARK